MRLYGENADGYRCRADGSINYDYYRDKGWRLRNAAIREVGKSTVSFARRTIGGIVGR